MTRGSRLHAENTNQGLAVDFSPTGIELNHGTSRLALTLTGVGSGETVQAVAPASPQATANRVEYRRGLLTEWYVNGPLGLEQGFTIASSPEGSPAGILTLALTLDAEMTAILDPQADGLTLAGPAGTPGLRYAGLTAVDATGRSLPTWLDLQGTALRLQVQATGARYPIVVDPFFQQAKLTASDGAANDGLGASVAISGDSVVAGAPLAKIGSNSFQGAVYVFGGTARAVKQGVIRSLQALLPTGDVTTTVLIKTAISSLSSSLSGTYWVDASHLKPLTGSLVFTFEQVAASQLKAIRTPPAGLGAALDAIAAADQALAQAAITDAIARHGNAAKIATAQSQITSALAAASTGNIVGAISLFRSAWMTAVGA